MHIHAIRTRPLLPPQDDLLAVIADSLDAIPPRSVVVVSSKVVSLWRGRCVEVSEDAGFEVKDVYAIAEAEWYLPREVTPYNLMHTIVQGMRIGSGGVDLSNGNGYLTLWPEDPDRDAEDIRAFLVSHYGIEEVGVIIADSQSVPMRNGVTGLAIGYSGFAPLRDYRGTKDVFGRPLRLERTNLADSLATAAVCEMGEGGECTPLACISDIHAITFTTDRPTDPALSLKVSMEEDVFAPFFARAPWQKGGGGYKK